MKTWKTWMSSFCWCLLAVLAVSACGADAALRGVVTDTAGKPWRGAIVNATLSPAVFKTLRTA
ncbi:MAG: hypothetical protein ABSA57_18405 [Candidatus Acidiferrales bacterium]|jgi:hypothetical protein